MQKKLLKILSVLVIVSGIAEALFAALIGGVWIFVFVQKGFFEQTDVYLKIMDITRENPLLDALGIDAVRLGAALLFLLGADSALKAVCNFIYGASGLKAAKGIKIKRARIIGTAALVIGICNLIDNIFVKGDSIGLYDTLYIASAAMFLYCVNGITSEKR